MKRIIAIIFTLAMFLTTLVYAAEVPEKVEIKFNIGDTILSINGKEVEVVAPYVQGEGTTMVPIRVITEAFGANVDWNAQEKEITINYPEVKIVMTVGSKSVMVNDHAETLSEAPVILGTGTTMVPLRFISETFAAQVSWDQETKEVTVVKDNIGIEAEKVQTSFDKEYITDSFYGWSMKTPSMQMDEMSDDRRYITFGNVEAGLDIEIYEADEGDTLEKELAYMKKATLSMSVSRAEICENSKGERCAVVAAKDDEFYISMYIYMKDGIIYSVMVGASLENKKEYDSAVLCAESFVFQTMKENATDISNTTNGLREYYSVDLGISFSAPADWISSVNGNTMYVTSENGSQITTYIYSKTGDVNTQTSAQKDYNKQLKHRDEKYNTFSELKETVVDGKTAYYYTVTINNTKYSDGVLYDYFIENGDYINNFTVRSYKKDNINIEDIMNSIKITDVDAQKAGNVLKDSFDENTVLDYNVGNMQISLPETWVVEGNELALAALDVYSGSMLTIAKEINMEGKSFLELAKEIYKVTTADGTGMKGLEAPTTFKIGNKSCAKFKVLTDENEIIVINVGYIINHGSNTYIVLLACSEEYDADKFAKEIENSLSNINWK